MGRRVGLLAGLLALTLGSGVVAQQASPTPFVAPEDLALTIPSMVGDYGLQIAASEETEFEVAQLPEPYLVPLLRQGALRTVMHTVVANAFPVDADPASAEMAFSVFVNRIEGLPASIYAEQVMEGFLENPEFVTPGSEVLGSEWRTIAGRDAYINPVGVVAYPQGEVLFVVIVWGSVEEGMALPLAEAVVAELP